MVAREFHQQGQGMANKATERKSAYLTPEQVEAMLQAVAEDEYDSASEWLRDLIRDRVEKKGIRWPDSDVQWGGVRTPKNAGEGET